MVIVTRRCEIKFNMCPSKPPTFPTSDKGRLEVENVTISDLPTLPTILQRRGDVREGRWFAGNHQARFSLFSYLNEVTYLVSTETSANHESSLLLTYVT